MDMKRINKKLNQFIDLVDLFAHMPKEEKTKNKTSEVQGKLIKLLHDVRAEVTKEVREIENNG